MAEVRIGLIGCGAMGQGHLAEWPKVAGARVTAVCDPNRAASDDTANRIGATPFTCLDAMLDSGLVDAVDICTPSGLHADQGIAAARRNLHVLVEKPLDVSIEKADRLIAECESRSLTLACIYQRRTFAGARQLAERVAKGEIGRVLSCSAYVKWFRSAEYYAASAWRGTWAMDGGVLTNQAVHAIDMLCWLAGPVAEVEYAHLATATHSIEAEDLAIAAVRFESGARGVVEATTCCGPDLCTRVELFGTRGSAALDDATVVRFGADGEDRLQSIEQEDGHVGGRSNPMDLNMRGHMLHLIDFVEAVRERRPPLVSGRDARLSLDAINKIYRKAFPGLKLGL